MNSLLHFPDATIMVERLSNHPLLSMDYYKEKGITKAIAELAAERFSETDVEEVGVKLGSMLIIHDLQSGKDGFTGEELPNLGKLGLNQMMWGQISMAAEKAIIDCARKG